MTDKERILMTLISELRTTSVLARPGPANWSSEGFRDIHGGSSYYVHFAPWLQKELKPGMLVICDTSMVSDWQISYLVQPLDEYGTHYWLLREIGTSRLCRMSNESFTPIIGMRREDLWEGCEYLFSLKVKKAFNKENSWFARYGGIDFHEGRRATVWVREAFGGLSKPSKPYPVEIAWTPHMTIKRISAIMHEAGFPERRFELIEQSNAPDAVQSEHGIAQVATLG